MACLTHVGDDRGEQVGNTLVDRQFQHFRVDQDQSDLTRIGLVEQGQDCRVDTDGFAGTGRACNQEVRHSGKIGYNRIACNIFTQRDGQSGRGITINFGTQDFRQADDLAFGVRQFECHVILAGNRFDDPDGNQREGTGEIAGQIDDGTALDASVRFDFITGDDRARIGGDDTDGHTEVRQFLFDQPAGEF